MGAVVPSAFGGLLLLGLLTPSLERLSWSGSEVTLCQGGSWALLLEEWSPGTLFPPGRALKPLRRVAECAGKQVYVMLH